MIQIKSAFSGFSVDDQAAAKKFYAEILGLKVSEDEKMGLEIDLPGGGGVFIYEKSDHQPASYTMLNLLVDNIDKAVDDLSSQGISFERYENMQQDEKGIARGRTQGKGPDIAWLTDPAKNIIAILQVD